MPAIRLISLGKASADYHFSSYLLLAEKPQGGQALIVHAICETDA